ncbi:uncharacterized protein ARMOST_16836 [Armillaria ostoyae]|uniref:CCHC-type domain-containing protein n=1 Tax=Armillaria ostoyae TaxID=47428 RepID=A0A284RXB6_ARMOS|nr:uncharacterized protein ARMOST_16836 [Armillaria ostoyae]
MPLNSSHFDDFHYDQETFGALPGYPFMLPDSPNWEYQHPRQQRHHPRCIQGYRPAQYRIHPFTGQDPPDPPIDNEQVGGSNDPPHPSREECLKQACLQSQTNRNEYNLLKAQLQAAQDKMTGHDMIWDLNQPPNNRDKGKKPERGRPFIPNYRRPLHEQEDQFSVPRPPPGRGCPHPMPQPIGHALPDAAYLGIKPILMQPPKSFKGAYDDIERFIGDCITYFEAFSAYFLLDSQTVPFAASYFEGPAKEWWVYKRPEFWANDDNDLVNARFRYPTWPEFVSILTTQFRDPAVEIVHERKMFEVHIGKNPASQFFYELEKEAKGLPESYTAMIANIGRDIPQTYPEWKARILVMYDERQKNYAFDQHLNHRDNRQPYKGATTTATSNNKAGGMTSSSSGKPTSNTAPSGGRDSQGRWLSRPGTTYGGAGAPMDIGQMHAQGLCFRCHKKGHMSKDCPEKKEFRDIRSVQVTEPVTESKIEEDLSTDIPTSNLLAFNISRTTSTPVLESQNRYAALSIEECDNNNNHDSDKPLKGCNDTSPARAEAKAANPAGHEAESLSTCPLRKLGQTDANRIASSPCGETQPTKAYGKSPTTATLSPSAQARELGFGSPCEVLLQDKQAALTQGRIPQGFQRTTLTSQPKVTGRIGNPASAVRIPPVVPQNDALQVRQFPPLHQKEIDEDHQAHPLKATSDANATATKKIAAGLEAASAQAVQRRHSVTLIKVPDEDNIPDLERQRTDPNSAPMTATFKTSNSVS